MVFIGHIISGDGIYIYRSKEVEGVLKWEKSINMMEIHSFLGLAGYYRRFIKGFSIIATPFTQLTRKAVK